jgi:hypothetical protein
MLILDEHLGVYHPWTPKELPNFLEFEFASPIINIGRWWDKRK